MNLWKEGFLWNRKWLWMLILLLLGLGLSYIKPLKLVEGGEVTYLSMMIIFLAGYFYGGKYGLALAFIFGGIKYFIDYPFVVNVPELWDYILGYGLLGVGGFVRHGRFSLQKGFLLAVLCRYIQCVVNCIYFYYMPNESLAANIRYGLVYCGGYIGTEAVVSFVLLCIPPVMEAINYLKYVATTTYEENLDTF